MILFDFLTDFVMALAGSVVGLLYEPRTPRAARLRKFGAGLFGLCGAVWIVALVTLWVHVPRSVAYAVWIAAIALLVAAAIVGNLCRRIHEGRW